IASLGLVCVSQPKNSGSIFFTILALFLAGMGNVTLGCLIGRIVLALLVELADLGAHRSKVVDAFRLIAFCLCSGRPGSSHNYSKHNHDERAPAPPQRHRTNLPQQSATSSSLSVRK